MASGSVWRVWIVWLSLSVTLSLGCERLQLLQILNAETLDKLNEMTQERIHTVHQTLRQINKVYGMNLDSVTWASDKVENFRLLLDRQLRELGECVRKTGSKSRSKRNTRIRTYFRKLRRFLKQKQFSNCAWEITRAETRAHLQQLLRIKAKVRRKN